MEQETIDVDAVRDLLDRSEPVTVLDIRPEDQWAGWRIPGSVNYDAYQALKTKDPGAMEGANRCVAG
jgi:rhodanese-related sulfurtransferase